MRILSMEIPDHELSNEELGYLSQFHGKSISLAEVWELMDRAWESAGAGYAEADREARSKFYASPVWLLNGIFSECDTESKRNRDGIAHWLARHAFGVIVDYGGGYGSLARKIAALCPDSKVCVVEPFPSKLARAQSKDFPNLSFVSTLLRGADCIVAQDVLEHIADPIDIFGQLLNHVRVGGYVIAANCFYPVIKCHFPCTFHLRYTFHHIVPSLGCRYVGTIPDVRYAQIFQRTETKPDWRKTRRREQIAKKLAPLLHVATEPVKILIKPFWKMYHG